jgi:hypothetical protein
MLTYPLYVSPAVPFYAGSAASCYASQRMPVNLSPGQPFDITSCHALTLPGVIPPTLVSKAAEVLQCQLKGLGRFPQQHRHISYIGQTLMSTSEYQLVSAQK